MRPTFQRLCMAGCHLSHDDASNMVLSPPCRSHTVLGTAGPTWLNSAAEGRMLPPPPPPPLALKTCAMVAARRLRDCSSHHQGGAAASGEGLKQQQQFVRGIVICRPAGPRLGSTTPLARDVHDGGLSMPPRRYGLGNVNLQH